MFKTALFDIEGTLVDYNKEFEIHWTKTLLQEFGLKIDTQQIIRYLSLDVTSREKQLFSWGYKKVRDFLDGWNTERAFSEKMKFTYCYPDINSLLKVREKVTKFGVITSAPKSLANRELKLIEDKLGTKIFDEVIYASHGSGIAMKPSPEGINLCLGLLFSSPENSFYVGNEDIDILAARNANVYSILIDRNRYTITETPHKIISSLKELEQII